MIQPQTIAFLKDLQQNNNKQWFEENRKRYEAAKTDFKNFAFDLFGEITKFDDEIGLEPDRNVHIFRINRDARFSKNKTPYKNNFGVVINVGGFKIRSVPAYYFHLEPGGYFMGGGLYEIEKEQLERIREKIVDNLDEFETIIKNRNFEKEFKELSKEKTLKRLPSGVNENNPAAEYLKLKAFFVHKELSEKEILSKDLIKKLGKSYKELKKLNDFLI